MDIKDLDLGQVEAVKGRGYVGVGKHLCGAATDMALRCMVNHKQRSGVSGCGLRGVVIALCCHHRCTWGQLVGSEFMLQLGFTPEDFDILSRMTSWAVCGRRPPAHEEEKTPAAEDQEEGETPAAEDQEEGETPAEEQQEEGETPAAEDQEEGKTLDAEEGEPPAVLQDKGKSKEKRDG